MKIYVLVVQDNLTSRFYITKQKGIQSGSLWYIAKQRTVVRKVTVHKTFLTSII